MFSWINIHWHLTLREIRERWDRLRDDGNRGSISVEFAVTAGLIVLGAVVIVGLIMAYGEEIANNIGSQ
jgi:hypothetical protein